MESSGSSSSSTEISNGNLQQNFTAPSSSTPAVSIIAQDPTKGLYIVDQSQQHATLQMFGSPDQRLMAGASGNPVELTTTNSGQAVAAQTIVMNGQQVLAQRLPVSMETFDEPLYVNAKQYHRIIKRRQARAKLEAEGKIPKQRKKYLHESRHQHACRRVRSNGGRFTGKAGDESYEEEQTVHDEHDTRMKQEQLVGKFASPCNIQTVS